MNGSSGFGSEGSALKAFFEGIEFPFDNGSESDDPSIDLNQLERGKRIAIRKSSEMQPPPVERKLDPLIEDLHMLHDHFERNTSYSGRVAKIMLEGLKRDFPHLYQAFVTRSLPLNYIPIIKVSNLNTPYIEFLLKAGFSDETPTSQLAGLQDEHLAFSKVLLDQLLDKVSNRQSTPRKRLSTKDKSQTDSITPSRSLPRRACRKSNSSYKV